MVSALLCNFGGSTAVPISAEWSSKSRDLLGLLKLGRIFLTMVKVKAKGAVVSDCLLPRGLYSPWNSPGQNSGVGSLSLLQGIFPTQGRNPGLLHCRRILYQLSHKGSPRILAWVACPFSSGSLVETASVALASFQTVLVFLMAPDLYSLELQISL